MTGIAKLVQEEIRRLARRETKPELERLKKECSELRRSVAQLNQRLHAVERNGNASVPEASEGSENGDGPAPLEVVVAPPSITAGMVKALRTKLRLTQAEFGRLVGVSGQSVYQWERRSGPLQLRRATRHALLRVKAMGVREARTLLLEKD